MTATPGLRRRAVGLIEVEGECKIKQWLFPILGGYSPLVDYESVHRRYLKFLQASSHDVKGSLYAGC